ncbi:MAG: hypothetical protein WC962_04030 [Phycisphaerae bacterium]|jgi:hypothetical protein
MSCKKPIFVLVCWVLLCAVSLGIYNGDFEEAESTGLLDQYGGTFYPPVGWVRENYAAVNDLFIPYPPDYNDEQADLAFWKIDAEAGVAPVEGGSLVVVASGDQNYEDEIGSITQSVYICPGQVLSGYYFFGSTDWLNDWAYIKLIQNGVERDPNEIVILYIEVLDVGPSSSMEGWGTFQYTFSAEESGGYDIVILAHDKSDSLLTSYLLVDGMSLSAYPFADLNHDCRVDFSDFNILARDWLQDCNDPAYLEDPCNLCFRGTNIDNMGLVDNNDLMLLTGQWLSHVEGPNEPNDPNLPPDPNDPNEP